MMSISPAVGQHTSWPLQEFDFDAAVLEEAEGGVKGETPQFMSQIAGQIASRRGSGSLARTSQRPAECYNFALDDGR